MACYLDGMKYKALVALFVVLASFNLSAQTQVVCCFPATSGGGSGTVTSVGLTAPAEITVAGSPVTTSGTLALTWAAAAQNTIFAGPSSGGAGTPLFRALASSDLPSTITGLSSVSSTNFVGALTGNVTGNVSGTSGSTTGNAATATALAANGTNCSAGNYPLGVDASGNVENCTAAGGGASLPATDTTALVEGSGDATKEFRVEIDGIATGTTVVMTPPATSFTAARTDAAQSFTGTQTIAGGNLILPSTLGAGVFFGADTLSRWGWRSTGVLTAYGGLGGEERMRIDGTGIVALADMTSLHTGGGGAETALTSEYEILTLSTSGTTTATVKSMAFAKSRIRAIYWRVMTTIATATDFSIKVTGGNNFVAIGTATTAQTALTASSSGVLVPATYADQFNAAATTVTVTTTGTPTAGSLRLVVVQERYIPPTS